jgi:hypothetical protein
MADMLELLGIGFTFIVYMCIHFILHTTQYQLVEVSVIHCIPWLVHVNVEEVIWRTSYKRTLICRRIVLSISLLRTLKNRFNFLDVF